MNNAETFYVDMETEKSTRIIIGAGQKTPIFNTLIHKNSHS
jgi:hypothetical protein